MTQDIGDSAGTPGFPPPNNGANTDLMPTGFTGDATADAGEATADSAFAVAANHRATGAVAFCAGAAAGAAIPAAGGTTRSTAAPLRVRPLPRVELGSGMFTSGGSASDLAAASDLTADAGAGTRARRRWPSEAAVESVGAEPAWR